jgi:hypothetical protein
VYKIYLSILLVCCSTLAFPSNIIIDNTGRIYAHFMGLQLEKSTINDCQNKFGNIKIIKDGDAANSSTRVNYYFEDEKSLVTFDSGEMGGGKFITSVIVSNIKTKEQYRNVDNYKFSNGDFGNIRLGLKQEIITNLFKNIKWNNAVAEVWHLNKIPIPPKDIKEMKIEDKNACYDENIVLRFYFSNKILTKFSIIKVTSY